MKTDGVSLLGAVRRYMDRTGMTATALGKAAVGDPRIIHDLRSGRIPRAKMQARILTYMEANASPATRVQRRLQKAAEGKAYALAWRARMKPYFDALYGPDEWAQDRRLGPTRKQIAALKAAA